MPLYMGGLLLTVVSMARIGFDNPHPGFALILPIMGMAAFSVGLMLATNARCPKCGTSVSPWISMYPAFWMWGGPPKCCPHCHVSLDDPV